MGFGRVRATVHLVEGSPWDEAIISVLAPQSPYRPWRLNNSESIRPGDTLIGSIAADTDKPMPRSTAALSSACNTTNPPRPTSPAGPPKARRKPRSSAASNAYLPAKSGL